MPAKNISSEQQLIKGLNNLGLQSEKAQIDKLLDYLQLLTKWNKTHNLTAIIDLDKMIDLHLLDSLSVLKHIKGPTLLDVGSGAGLPGLIIAVFRPDIQVSSIDTRGKKIQFQQFVASELDLDNFHSIHSRVEEYQVKKRYQQIISRAFSSLDNFLSWTKHLLEDDGQWLAMKGQIPHDELKELLDKQDLSPTMIEPLQVPISVGERHLLTFKR